MQRPGHCPPTHHRRRLGLLLLVPHRSAGSSVLQRLAYIRGGQRGLGHLRDTAQLGVEPLSLRLQRDHGETSSGGGKADPEKHPVSSETARD